VASRFRHTLNVILAGAFLAAQWAAIQHSTSHLRHDLAAACEHVHHDGASASFSALAWDFGVSQGGHALGHPASGGDEAPLDHPAALCLVFHALDCKTAAPAAIAVASSDTHPALQAAPQVQRLSRTAVAYRSRAPPAPLS
jgi:hypothetical protein